MLFEGAIATGCCGRMVGHPIGPQRLAHDRLIEWASDSQVATLTGRSGSGKSNLLRFLERNPAWPYTSARSLSALGEVAFDETFVRDLGDLLGAGWASSDVVLLDDLGLAGRAIGVEPSRMQYVVDQLCDLTSGEPQRRLVIALSEADRAVVKMDPKRILDVEIASFVARDYKELLGSLLGVSRIQEVDFDALYTLAPSLSSFDLYMLASTLHVDGLRSPTTANILEFAEGRMLSSPTDSSLVASWMAKDLSSISCDIGS